VGLVDPLLPHARNIMNKFEYKTIVLTFKGGLLLGLSLRLENKKNASGGPSDTPKG
jgi:hypothetical protein